MRYSLRLELFMNVVIYCHIWLWLGGWSCEIWHVSGFLSDSGGLCVCSCLCVMLNKPKCFSASRTTSCQRKRHRCGIIVNAVVKVLTVHEIL